MRKLLAAFALSATLSACVTYGDSGPTYENGPAAPAGTPVALGQPVWAGDVVATPTAIAEDSRCPKDATCVWAGRLVVTTRIDGSGWRETVDLALGQAQVVRGTSVTLVSAMPERQTEAPTPPGSYRFVYSGG